MYRLIRRDFFHRVTDTSESKLTTLFHSLFRRFITNYLYGLKLQSKAGL